MYLMIPHVLCEPTQAGLCEEGMLGMVVPGEPLSVLHLMDQPVFFEPTQVGLCDREDAGECGDGGAL